MKNTFYTYYAHPKNSPLGLAKFRVEVSSIKKAIEKWPTTEASKHYDLFMVQKCVEQFLV